MNRQNPPKFPLKLLRWFCHQDKLEELEGDLYEVFNELIQQKGLKKARLLYGWLVIRSFRSYAINGKSIKSKKRMPNTFTFVRHHVKVARRNLWKNKVTTFINITGLAIGISGFLAIFSIIQYEFSFDRHIPDGDRIYRIYTEFKGVFQGSNRGGSTAMPSYLRENFSQFEVVSVFYNWTAKPKLWKTSEYATLEKNQDIIITDSSYFLLADQYEWLYGSPQQSLRDPGQVVLTKAQAEKYFNVLPVEEYIGQKVMYQDSLEVYVSGIVESSADLTDFVFTDFISIETLKGSFLKEKYPQNDWSSISSSTQTFVKLNPGIPQSILDTILAKLNKHAYATQTDTNWITSYNYQSLADLHFNTQLNLFDNRQAAAHKPSLKAMLWVSVALLVIALFNFINLETAQSATKAKEVGLRKVLGSTRKLLISRFLTESTLLTFWALVLSVPLTYWGLQYFEEFVPGGMVLEVTKLSFWGFIILLLVVVSLISGTYPALVIASFSPLAALKIKPFTSSKGQKGSIVRKLLISFQFVFSQALIVVAVVMFMQTSFMIGKDLGFSDQGIVIIETPHVCIEGKSGTFCAITFSYSFHILFFIAWIGSCQ